MDVEVIRRANPIVSVVQEYVNLKQVGDEYTGICPFHNDSAPSFSVNPDKGLYYCYGCSMGGDVFSFISEIESLSFKESLKFLADRAGIEYEKTSTETNNLRNNFKELADYFHSSLMSSDRAKDYLKRRKSSRKIAEDFQLGYCGDESDFRAFYKQSSLNKDALRFAGVLKKNKDGEEYFAIRDTIVFPFFSSGGLVVGFGFKHLWESKSKYVNTPNRDGYKKSHYFYGQYQNKKLSRKKDCCIVVEGYFDVLTGSNYGYPIFGVCSTNISVEQVQILLNLSSNVVLALDSDAPGIKGMYKALPLFLSYGVFPKVVLLNEYKDVDEYLIATKGDILESAITWADFAFKYLGSVNSDDSFKIKHVKSLLSKIDDLSIRMSWASVFSTKLKVHPDLLFNMSSDDSVEIGVSFDSECSIEKKILALSFLLGSDNLSKGLDLGEYTGVYNKIIDSGLTMDGLDVSLKKELQDVITAFKTKDYNKWYHLLVMKYWLGKTSDDISKVMELKDSVKLRGLIRRRNDIQEEIRVLTE